MNAMKLTDALIGVLVATMWGSAFFIIEIGLREFPPIFNASLRFFVASVPFVFFVKRGDIPWKWILIIGTTFVLMFSTMYVGMRLGMPAGLTSLVLQSQVLFTVILAAIILRDKPKIWQKIGVAIGIVGIGMIAFGMTSVDSLAALFLVIIAALFYGLISIWLKMAGKHSMLNLIVWVSLIPPLPLLALSLIFEQGQWDSILNISGVGAFSVFYTSIIGTVLPFALWGMLLKKYSPHIVSPFALLVPVVGMVTSAMFLNEEFTLIEIYASILIIMGLIVALMGERLFATLRGRSLSFVNKNAE